MGTNGKQKTFVTVGEAAALTGLDSQTVRKLADKASIACYRTPAGQRRINLQSIQELCSGSISSKEEQNIPKKNFVYARVSSKKQMDDLSRQLDYIKRPEYSDYTVIRDIGSGINFQRKGLSTILDACLQGVIGELVIANKDRLCRFGYDLIEQLVSKAGGKITVLQQSDDRTGEQELADDLLAIIHIFSCRQMGKRRYANRGVKNIESKDLSDSTTKEVTK
jgi:excisionase family DNA binding protein